MDLVWASQLGASRKLVALSYANSAHDEDGRAWASIAYLERRTGLDRKTIINAITALEKTGFLSDTGERRGKTSSIKVYMVAVPETGLHSSTGNGGKLYRNSHEAVPFFPGSSTENGTQRRTGDVPETLGDVSARRKRTARPINGVSKDESPVLAKLPLRGGGEFEIRGSFVSELEPIYPDVDVTQTLREMRGWCLGNPERLKTRRGVKRFITSWLQNEQAKGDA
jgi:hypothetical protein